MEPKLRSFLFFLGLAAAVFFTVSPAQASSPSAIVLEYDKGQKILHTEVKHVVSSNLPQHRIRKMVFYKNEAEIQTFHYPTQKPAGVTQDLPADLKAGDLVKVIAYCSEAGPKEEILIIPGDGEKDSLSEKAKASAPVEKMTAPPEKSTQY